ncbi:MAG: hypothetical protein CL843_07800 [Crocinitomicaceae bacterium]|nr:hypothetical protein [Crocinitomicaceae bacterium]
MKKAIPLLVLGLIGCKSTKSIDTNNNVGHNNKEKTSESVGTNQVETISTNSKFINQNSESKIIFNGENNTVIFNYFDSFFTNENSNTVIIVEGNGNTIELTHNHVTSNRKNLTDTLVISNDFSYIELLNEYLAYNLKDTTRVQHISLDAISVVEKNSSPFFPDESDSSTIENMLTGEWQLISEVYAFYLQKAIEGNQDATFYLGQFYEMGITVDRDLKKAAYYYEIAAKSGHVLAQVNLGFLYSVDYYELGKDLEKARYWLERAAEQGNEQAVEKLKDL